MLFSTLGEYKVEQRQMQISLVLSMLPFPCVHTDDQQWHNIAFPFNEMLDHHCDSKIQNYFVVT